MRRIGITTTVPAEFIFAAGGVPVDLNNVFIADAAPMGMMERAERDGLPRAVCGWIRRCIDWCRISRGNHTDAN